MNARENGATIFLCTAEQRTSAVCRVEERKPSSMRDTGSEAVIACACSRSLSKFAMLWPDLPFWDSPTVTEFSFLRMFAVQGRHVSGLCSASVQPERDVSVHEVQRCLSGGARHAFSRSHFVPASHLLGTRTA